MLLAFTVGFQKVYQSCILLLMAFPGLTETFLNSCQLEGFYYDFL